MEQTITAEKIFTGTGWLYNHNVTIDNGIIQSVEPNIANGFIKEDADTFLAPAFIDFQVYGAAGKLLAVYPTADTLQTMQDTFSKQGTCLFQPTLATNTVNIFK